MHNQFTSTELAIDDLFDWINDKGIGENIRYIYGMTEELKDKLTELRTCFNDSVHDDRTERVFDLLECQHHVSDADLEYTARKFLVDPDMSDRQKVIDQLSAFVGL